MLDFFRQLEPCLVLIKARTALVNEIRGLLGEFGWLITQRGADAPVENASRLPTLRRCIPALDLATMASMTLNACRSALGELR